MVRATVLKDDENRVTWTYDKCDGTFVTTTIVDKVWFDAQDTEHLTPEELHDLAYKDRGNSQVEGITQCWGLG